MYALLTTKLQFQQVYFLHCTLTFVESKLNISFCSVFDQQYITIILCLITEISTNFRQQTRLSVTLSLLSSVLLKVMIRRTALLF